MEGMYASWRDPYYTYILLKYVHLGKQLLVSCEDLSTCMQKHFISTCSTSRVPVEGKSSVCLICMKYRIIILIIIIISLGKILLSYIANTSCTHARAHTHASTHTHAAVQVIAICWRPTVTARSAGDNADSWVIQINTRAGDPISPRFWMFFAYKKIARPN